MGSVTLKGADGSWIHMSFSDCYRLRLADGRVVFMTWHSYCGPSFYHDRGLRRENNDWWKEGNELGFLINQQLEWFIKRGEIA